MLPALKMTMKMGPRTRDLGSSYTLGKERLSPAEGTQPCLHSDLSPVTACPPESKGGQFILL